MELTKSEGIFIRRLLIINLETKKNYLLFEKDKTFTYGEVVNYLERTCERQFAKVFIGKCIKKEILVSQKMSIKDKRISLYKINKPRIFEILHEDLTFQLDEKIIEGEHSIMIE